MQLEWLAGQQRQPAYRFEIECMPAGDDSPMLVDTRPMIREMVEELSRGAATPAIASRFHNTLAEIVVEICLPTAGKNRHFEGCSQRRSLHECAVD